MHSPIPSVELCISISLKPMSDKEEHKRVSGSEHKLRGGAPAYQAQDLGFNP